MDIYENRRSWLRHWVEKSVPGGRPAFEKAYEYTRAQVTQFLSVSYNDGRSIGDVAARRIEKKLGMPERIMDTPFSEGVAERKLSAPPVDEASEFFGETHRHQKTYEQAPPLAQQAADTLLNLPIEKQLEAARYIQYLAGRD